MQCDNDLDEQDVQSGSDSATSSGFSLWTIASIPCIAAAYFLSRPIFSFVARELCYLQYGYPTFWQNPFSTLRSLVYCEYSGAAAFRWQEGLHWMAENTKSAVAIATSVVGSITCLRQCTHRRRNINRNSDVLPLHYSGDNLKGNYNKNQQATDFDILNPELDNACLTKLERLYQESLSLEAADNSRTQTYMYNIKRLQHLDNSVMIGEAGSPAIRLHTPNQVEKLNQVGICNSV